jgi:hypothetical protein
MAMSTDRTATQTATGPKISDLKADHNCMSDAEPPVGIEPTTYALRVNRNAIRRVSLKYIRAGQTHNRSPPESRRRSANCYRNCYPVNRP